MHRDALKKQKGIILDKFVLQLPKWQGGLLFSKGTLMFVGVILLLIVGTLFCFWGYKYFRTVLFLGIGVVVCYGSYLLVEPMTANLVIRMFVTVSLTFLGMCFVYFLDIVFGYLLDRLRIRSALGKRTYLFAAPLGAAVLGLTIYGCIWRDAVVAAGISLACLVLGLVFQHHRRKGMVRFRCYNDLLRLRRPKIDGRFFRRGRLLPRWRRCLPHLRLPCQKLRLKQSPWRPQSLRRPQSLWRPQSPRRPLSRSLYLR